ncbi:MAG: FAD binding domain-containing protein [Anaerolineales bacterium]|jgi:carbon-monoxide dehydrogenase medium subunit
MNLWDRYLTPTSLDEAIQALHDNQGNARIVAGATDLILELERGQRPNVTTLIDITRIPGLDMIRQDDGVVHMGPLVTHNHCATSSLIVDRAYVLARACWEVGAPQIRNRGTVAGNLITASPANDSIPALMALGAQVLLRSYEAERLVPLADFYEGVRKTVMRPDEMLVDISFSLPGSDSRSTFLKLGLRRAQAISIVNTAVVLEMNGQIVDRASITLGSVAPTIVNAEAAEASLSGVSLTPETIERAAIAAQYAAHPIDDVRGSSAYRAQMVKTIVGRALRSLAAGDERQGYPEHPVTLWGPAEYHWTRELEVVEEHDAHRPIHTTINGKQYVFDTGQGKTLLRLLREEGELIGTKEGCAEGECGACTVFLDGMAVMACMVPAPRAHGADIITVEGLAHGDQLHPIQQAFLDQGAVQCGYCTPGFLMSGAKLLEERQQPTRWDIQQSLTGNLCRCTGYYKIVDAVEQAARESDRSLRSAAD